MVRRKNTPIDTDSDPIDRASSTVEKMNNPQAEPEPHVPAPIRPRFVLDTSLFVNPDARRKFGESVDHAVNRLLKITRERNFEIYMPVSVFRELSNFASSEALISFRRDAVVRSPDLYSLQIPAAVFHSFIREMRDRINKGLRIAEDAIYRKPTPENLRRLRQEYREALRGGMVDSTEDLDVILLAKEIGGTIISADEGIAKMAEALGIEVCSASYFISMYGEEEGTE